MSEDTTYRIRFIQSDGFDPKNPTVSDLLGGIDLGEGLRPPDNPFREKVQQVLYPLEDLLIEKNESYGNSALEPINVFSKADAVEQLKVRIDDKLSRLYHGKDYGNEDTVTDLLGYLVLLKIAEKEITE